MKISFGNFRFDLIVEYMKKHGLTDEEFCKLCKITLKDFNRLKNNDLNVKVTPFMNIVKVIKVRPSELMNQKVEK